MAFVHGKATDFLVGAYDLTSYFKDVSFSSEFDMAETSTFGTTYKTFIQGLGNTTCNSSGLYDSTAVSGPDVVLSSLIGSTTTTPVTFAPGGIVLGDVCYSLGANLANYEVTSSIGDAVMISSQFQSVVNSGGKRGQILCAAATISATGAQTGQGNNGTAIGSATSSTNGGYGFLHVTTNSRDGACTFKIQHSSDTTNGVDGVWADLITFTNTVASTVTSEYVQVAAGTTVNKALRFNCTTFGGASGSLVVTAGFVRL